MKQKFKRGDRVMIVLTLEPYMSHFPSGVEAIVLGSYRDEFGGPDIEDTAYSLNIKGHGFVAWYNEDQLTLVKAAPFVSVKFNGQ